MKDLEISRNLRVEIETNQIELQNAIRRHQKLSSQRNKDDYCEDITLEKEINKAADSIIVIGIAQKSLFTKLREECRHYQKTSKSKLLKSQIEDRRLNLNNALNRARKNIANRSIQTQHCLVAATVPIVCSPPYLLTNAELKQHKSLEPQDLSQNDYLSYFGLVTHDAFKELQNRRVERKRRSTANPHFLYGNKNWDFPPRKPRKQTKTYLQSTSWPPNTRQQTVRKKNGTSSPPLRNYNNLNNNNHNVNDNNKIATENECKFEAFPSIPNLPNGLTIERVNTTAPRLPSPDAKTCIVCRQNGTVSICANCGNGFHISCHNRPLTTTPRLCPRCIVKELRNVGSLSVPSGMTISYVHSADAPPEQLEQKKKLESDNKTLCTQLTDLEDHHSQLIITLKNQKVQRDELLVIQQNTEEKIKQIVGFIDRMKGEFKAINKKPTTATNTS